MGKKTNLKATLLNHQERQRKTQLQKTREAAKKEAVKKFKKSASSKAKGKRPQSTNITITIPVRSSDTILLVGEGNFSFTRALFASGHPCLEFLPPANVTATTYDSEEACYIKYPDAKEIVEDLREKGVSVLFGIDARHLDTYKELKKKKWRRVIWNFPHAGKGVSDQDRNVLSNQILLLDFFKSVATLLETGAVPSLPSGRKRTRPSDGESNEDAQESQDEYVSPQALLTKERGTVLITLRNTTPYTLWDLSRLAKKPPPIHSSSWSTSTPNQQYVQLRSFVFRRNDWKGYEHRMTKGWVEGLGTGADRVIEQGKGTEDRTWEFYLAG